MLPELIFAVNRGVTGKNQLWKHKTLDKSLKKSMLKLLKTSYILSVKAGMEEVKMFRQIKELGTISIERIVPDDDKKVRIYLKFVPDVTAFPLISRLTEALSATQRVSRYFS